MGVWLIIFVTSLIGGIIFWFFSEMVYNAYKDENKDKDEDEGKIE